jgi:hemoglobin
MYNYWNTVLFPARTYKGNPFSKHMTLPIDKTHFSQWLNLFNQSIDEHFKGDMAEEAKNRAIKMAYLFQSKLEYLANNPQMKPVI